MAEIKSTLDLIMEKTRDMSLTEEEKKAIQYREMEGKVRGLLTRYADGLIEFDNFADEIKTFEEHDQSMVQDILVQETLARIAPETDNRLCLGILKRVAGIDISSLSAFIDSFQKDLENRKEIRRQELIQQIQEKGISGTAVNPNLNADSEWLTFLKQSKQRFQKKVLLNYSQLES